MLIAALAALNIKGTQESARLNLILALGDLATQVLLVVVGMLLVLSPDTLIGNVDLGVAPSWGDFALGIALGMIAYTGIETISNMSEEAISKPRAVDPARRSAAWSSRCSGSTRCCRSIALSAMPVHAGRRRSTTRTELRARSFAGDPVPRDRREHRRSAPGSRDVLRLYVGVLAAAILVIATNAGLIGVSRLTYSMGQHRQLPERLRQVHPTLPDALHRDHRLLGRSPDRRCMPGQGRRSSATMYAFGAMLSFTIAHVAVLVAAAPPSRHRARVEAARQASRSPGSRCR